MKTDTKLQRLKKRAERLGIEYGWLWLYENGFRHCVPAEIIEKIKPKKPIIKGGEQL